MIFQTLLDYGLDVDCDLEPAITPLACRITMKLREMTAFMLSMGANPNRSYTSDKDTFLGVAAEVESPDSLNLLTEHGARVEGSQALRYATKVRRIMNTEGLLVLCADIDEVFTKTVYYPAKEEAWGYALHFAVEGKQVEFVRFLLSVVPKQTN